MGLNVLVEIFRVVVVGQLFAGLDDTEGLDVNAIAVKVHFAVWLARVVNVACDILACCSVDGFSVVHLEQVLAIPFVRLFVCQQFAPIFCNKHTFGNFFFREQPEAGRAAFYLECVRVRTRFWIGHTNNRLVHVLTFVMCTNILSFTFYKYVSCKTDGRRDSCTQYS